MTSAPFARACEAWLRGALGQPDARQVGEGASMRAAEHARPAAWLRAEPTASPLWRLAGCIYLASKPASGSIRYKQASKTKRPS